MEESQARVDTHRKAKSGPVLTRERWLYMPSDIVPGAIFPDYELSDHTAKHRKLSDREGPHPMVLILSLKVSAPRIAGTLKGWFNSIVS